MKLNLLQLFARQKQRLSRNPDIAMEAPLVPAPITMPCQTPGCTRWANMGCTTCCRKCTQGRAVHSRRCEPRQAHFAGRATGPVGTPLRLNPSWVPMWFGACLPVRTFLLHAHETREEFSMDPSTSSRSFKSWLQAQLAAVHPDVAGDQGSNAELIRIIQEILQQEP